MMRVVRPGARRILNLTIIPAAVLRSLAEFRPTLERDVDLSLFDLVMDSSAEGTRKPEAEIYHRTTAMLGVDATDVVYLDDFEHNLVPARTIGWQTIHVTDPSAALVDLDRLMSRGPD